MVDGSHARCGGCLLQHGSLHLRCPPLPPQLRAYGPLAPPLCACSLVVSRPPCDNPLRPPLPLLPLQLRSLLKQVEYCLHANKTAAAPVCLTLTSLSGQLAQMAADKVQAGLQPYY